MGALDWVGWLLEDGDVAARIGGRLNPGVLPLGEAFPAVGYTQVSDPRGYSHDGDDGLARARWQFLCWARTYAEAHAVGEAVIAAAYRWRDRRWQCFVAGASDEESPEPGVWTRRVDLILWHRR